ncbi:hypothetical protein BJ165DRAFT_1353075, partial [Panaeolus papilionaceus]
LKAAAQAGHMLSDPLGYMCWCFTFLAAYIVDTPESALIACVAGKTSSVTLANYKQFSDPFPHLRRHPNHTLEALEVIKSAVGDIWDLEAYEKEAMKHRLNGVHEPFWRDWVLSDPSIFLTSEPLHHWHKQFWDHDAKWCINAVGKEEIDFRFSILQRHVGFKAFKHCEPSACGKPAAREPPIRGGNSTCRV